MAGPCFWAELRNVKQECGDPEPPQDIQVSFNNGYIPVDEQFLLAYQPGFSLGQDFTLNVEGDQQYLLRYRADQDRYYVWKDGEQSSYTGPNDVPGQAAQGAEVWPVRVYSFWS